MIRLVLPVVLSLLFSASILAAAELPREEYPRPDFIRADWHCLNGPREFQLDDSDVGLREQWQNGSREFKQRIIVPYPFQSRLSGIGETSFHDVLCTGVVRGGRSVEGPTAKVCRGCRVAGHSTTVILEV